MRYGSLFSGYGGLDLAVEEVFGAECAWHSDIDPDVSRVLAKRWPGVPNIGDVSEVGDPARLFAWQWDDLAPVDIVCGGFPCQDISRAGKGAGLVEGTRSGLWFEMARAVRLLRPAVVIVENVPLIRSRGLDRVLGDLAEVGYDAAWTSLRASDVGAPHRRERVFVLARDRHAARPLPNPGRQRHGRRQVVGMVGRMGTAAESRGRDPGPARQVASDRSPTDWRQYRAAVERWEAIIGRPAPDPLDRTGRLSVVFTEWLMGLPAGWVTDVLDRDPARRALGNGVVPLQGVVALDGLVDL